jgi:thiol-disulfide isomerase/thioredoxin
VALEKPLIRAPEFPPLPWLNSPDPLTMGGLRGRVVLLDVWDFTCINCLRTLPYLRAWWERYEDAGLSIIGIHTPEFDFAHDRRHVAAAIGRLGIRWPVTLDNQQEMWTALANRYWPTLYVVDKAGYLRYRKTGEGGYAQTELALQELLREISPDVGLPPVLDPLRAEDAPGAVCLRATPELQAGSLGNGRASPLPSDFEPPPTLQENHFYLRGSWREAGDGLTLVDGPGEILLSFHAASIHVVLSPGPDPLALPPDPIRVRVELDDGTLTPDHYGGDVFQEDGQAWLRVDAPRLFHLAAGLDSAEHVLRLHLADPGLTFYAFSFDACLASSTSAATTLQEAKLC